MNEPDMRPGAREERSRHAVAAAVDLAREHGIRVDAPHVLADFFSVMVHLRPAPVVARISTWTSKVHTPIEDWLAREIDVTGYLHGQGAPSCRRAGSCRRDRTPGTASASASGPSSSATATGR